MSFLKKSFAFPVQLTLAVCVLVLLLGADTAGAQIRTVIVSPVPGNPVASGTALRNALGRNFLSVRNEPVAAKIEPGTYDIAGTSLAMRAYVDVEGSGIEATTILNGNPSGFESVTILGADNARFVSLTVQAIAPTSTSDIIAMANYNVSPRVYRVKLVSQATSAWGMRNVNAAPLVEECEISVTSTSATPSFAYGLVFRGLPPGSRRGSILRSQVKVSGAAKNYGVFMADALSVTSIRDSSFDVAGAEVPLPKVFMLRGSLAGLASSRSRFGIHTSTPAAAAQSRTGSGSSKRRSHWKLSKAKIFFGVMWRR